MRVEKHEGRSIRRVLAAMVSDPVVCARVAAKWTPDGLFDAPWANVVGGWCVRHMAKYGRPPNGQLESIFGTWAAKRRPGDKTVEAVEQFLQATSDEAAADLVPQSDYMLDLAEAEFNRAKVRQLNDALAGDLAAAGTAEAIARIGQFAAVRLGADATIAPAADVLPWREAFNKDRLRPLVTYPDALGRFYGHTLGRGKLYGWMASDKVGKSYHLLDLAYRAVRQRCRVVFFDTGDNDKDEVMHRLARRTLLAPAEAGIQRVPVRVGEGGKVKTEARQYGELSPKEAWAKFARICRDPQDFRIECHPNSTLTVAGIDSTLADWERRDGWVPDVVVIDYADDLAPPAGVREKLDQIDETWKALRRLSQQRHCLVATATQANAAAYKEGGLLGKKHFGGRKTKMALVNGMVAITATSEDKDRGICRLNWVVLRGARFSEKRPCFAAGNLALACPTMKSYY